MKAVPYKNNFYKLSQLDASDIEELKIHIPVEYRFYDAGNWYVHKDFLNAIMTSVEPESSVLQDFQLLYLQPNAPEVIIDVVWRRLASMYHPDKGGDPEDFKRLLAAYQRIKEAK